MAATVLNKEAGAWLRSVRNKRKRAERSAPKFAATLSELLAPTTLTAGTLYAYEKGDRTVPAAIMLAASRITREPIALDEATKESLADELFERMLRRMREKGQDV